MTGCVHVEELVRQVKGRTAEPELETTAGKTVVFEGLPFWQKALAYEQEGELQRALMFADIAGELSKGGVCVMSRGKKTLKEEMPDAYKDVANVVDVVHNLDIAKKVIKIKPVGVIKG